MDREKQIEEMIHDMCHIFINGKCGDVNTCEEPCANFERAKRLIAKGYRKINDNEVVLSREEYNDLKYSKIIKNSLDKSVKYYQELIEEGKLVPSVEVEETAEKILNYLDRHLGNGKPSGNVLRDCAKQFGVEIGE